MDFHNIQEDVHGVEAIERLGATSAIIIKDQMRRFSAYIVLVRNPPSMRSDCSLICWLSKAHIIFYRLPY